MIDHSKELLSINHLYYDRKLAARIGDMIVAWSWTEAILIRIMTYFLAPKNEQIGYNTYMLYPNFRSRYKAIQGLVNKSDWPTATKNDLNELLDALYCLWGRRNDWVHGHWATDKDKKRTYIVDYSQDPRSQQYWSNVDSKLIEDHIREVYELKDKLEEKLKALCLVAALLDDDILLLQKAQP